MTTRAYCSLQAAYGPLWRRSMADDFASIERGAEALDEAIRDAKSPGIDESQPGAKNAAVSDPVGPPRINQAAFYGLLDDFVEAGTRNSEASPVAIAASTMALFSALIGRCAYQWIGD